MLLSKIIKITLLSTAILCLSNCTNANKTANIEKSPATNADVAKQLQVPALQPTNAFEDSIKNLPTDDKISKINEKISQLRDNIEETYKTTDADSRGSKVISLESEISGLEAQLFSLEIDKELAKEETESTVQ